MEVSRPHAKEPSPETLQDLKKLQAMLEWAIADGKISQAEVTAFMTAARSDGKVSVDELGLYRTFVLDKIAKGELDYDWS
ncbi:hypothetical protein DO97_04680 [Neosynechococcus sphagnicola sy1]|uniref:Uncharacterized protein n=1 Tax=Neosynechococcus sphagnicola sy1 TaxID=1497020 RepID=A0A098TKI1_9CYAN|nr:hypothetical protein [Neosynechococcus sphagnicola]KGF72786.1 hypothetical protein DO97_04680 [Neosynechococcus sphagnicola sy1]